MAASYEDIMNAIDYSTTLTGGDGSGGGGLQDFLGNLGLLGGLAQGIGGTAALTGAYDRLGSIGEAAQQGALGIAQAGLDQTQFQPFSVTSATGGQFGYDPTTGAATMGLSPQEQALQGMLMNQAQTTLGATPYGQQAGRAAAEQAYGLGGEFMGAAGMPTADREAAVYERLRAAQRPEEERRALALEERLQNQGRGGVRTSMFGGTPEQLAMSKAQAEAQNTAMLGAMQQAQAEQRQQAQLGQAFTGMGSQLSAQDMAMLSGQQQLGLGALGGSYIPQAQLLSAMQGSQLYPQLQQRGQLTGAGLFGEASMGGLEALLGAGLGQANLMGQLGTGLIGGLATPTDSYGGLSDVLGDVGGFLEGLGLFGD
jgi:hypothetical protein